MTDFLHLKDQVKFEEHRNFENKSTTNPTNPKEKDVLRLTPINWCAFLLLLIILNRVEANSGAKTHQIFTGHEIQVG